MRERTVEAKIKKYIESIGGLCLKWTSPGYTGVPDRIALLPEGRVVFIEVKRPGLKDGRTARQKRVGCLLQERGHTVVTASSVADVREAIKEKGERGTR